MRKVQKDFAPARLQDEAERLGGAIRAARVARGVSRNDFSVRANISPSTLVRIEKGDVSVSFLAWLQALERAGLLGLLERAAEPSADAIGETQRRMEQRRRPRGTPSEKDKYDF